MTNEAKSLEGSAHHTPSTPSSGGSIINSGSRKSSCRDKERKMLMRALPIDWKKLVTTAW